MPSKLIRQNRIKEILLTVEITSQEQLVKILQEESIDITQATLSRDFAELGVIRVSGENGIRYVINADETNSLVNKLVGFEILSVAHNESVVVIRTLAGRAQGVAYMIDRMNQQEILGTVAGDDTVIIIPDSIKNVGKIVAYVKELMMNIPKQNKL